MVTGIGKTELAKQVSKYIHKDDKKAFVRGTKSKDGFATYWIMGKEGRKEMDIFPRFDTWDLELRKSRHVTDVALVELGLSWGVLY